MIDISELEAVRLASTWVADRGERTGYELEIDKKLTERVDAGWIFFFDLSDRIRGRNVRGHLIGAGPLFISKAGEIHEFPGYQDWDKSLADFLKRESEKKPKTGS